MLGIPDHADQELLFLDAADGVTYAAIVVVHVRRITNG